MLTHLTLDQLGALGLHAMARYGSFKPVASIGSSKPDCRGRRRNRGHSSRMILHSAVVAGPIAAVILTNRSMVQPA